MNLVRRSLIDVRNIMIRGTAPSPAAITTPSIQSLPDPSHSITSGWLPRYSTFANNEDENRRRVVNRLLYRSKQRGFLELDLVLGKWVEENINSMGENDIRALTDVLDQENPDLWKWLTSQEQPPEAIRGNSVFQAVHEKVTSNLTKHSSPETRAIPGEQWVRGWDDIKKAPGGPITGNQ